MTKTRTGVYCFAYSGPTTPASGLATLLSSSVVSMNKFNLPDGDFSSWFRAAPTLATIPQVASGDLLCVPAAPGSAVFS